MLLFFLYIVCYDIWFYISHILLHNPKIYFIHKIHHKKSHDELQFMDAYEGHSIETVVQSVGIFVPLVIYPISVGPFLLAVIFVNIRNGMRHDDRFSWLIGNHHLLHHKYPKYNFGEYWIDCIAGTCCPHNGKVYI